MKKGMSFLLSILMIISMLSFTAVGTWAQEEEFTNVALGKTATASQVYTTEREGADCTVDGLYDKSHKWSSGFFDLNSGAWVTIDLGATYQINRWAVYHAQSGGEAANMNTRDFKLQASMDGQSFVDVDSVIGNTAAKTDRTVKDFAARYVRLFVSVGGASQTNVARINEIEIYGKKIYENVALGKSATASQVYSQEREGADCTVDGIVSKDSKWSSGFFDAATGAWITVDLGDTYIVDRWVVYHAQSGGETASMNTRNFKLQASSDGQTFIDVDTVTDNTAAMTDRTVEPFKARYVRLFVENGGYHQPTVARINEFEVYGYLANSNVALGKDASASQVYTQDGQGADCTVDGIVSKDSKWASGFFDIQKGAWVTIDLGAAHVIDRWVVYHAQSGGESASMNTKDFKLQASSDGDTFVDIDAVTGNTDAKTDRAVDPFKARYVRLFVSNGGANQNNVARINEIELYGCLAAGDIQTDDDDKDDPVLDTIKFMPVGDSITQGNVTAGGWRSPLKVLLNNAEIKTDFVGSSTAYPGPSGDNEHCGYGGWRIKSTSDTSKSLYHYVKGWMQTYKPDVMTFMAGTNDIWWEDTVNTEGLRDIIGLIFETDPNVKLFVGSIAPVDEAAQDYPIENFNSKVEQYNAAIPGIVDEYAKQGYSVYFVDINSVLTEADLCDGVHPHQTGYRKMAEKWYSGMINVLQSMSGNWTNLALGNSTALEAVDDNNATIWAADASESAPYIEIKLPDDLFVGRYVVKHAGSAGEDESLNTAAFTLKISMDSTNWETVDTVTGNTGDKSDRVIDTRTAKYVRLYIDDAGADDTARICEFRLYGPRTLQDTFQHRTYTSSKYTHSLPYRLFVPENYDPAKEYPLVVVFHGAGERGNDNEKHITAHQTPLVWAQPEVQKDNPCFVVAAQCPVNEQWVDTPWAQGSYDLDSVPISDEMQMVVDIIDQLSGEFSIDTTRMYSTGISMGGFATWNINMLYPDLFAAMAPICGGADPSKAELLADKPIWTFHGDADTSVPVKGTRDMVAALRELGSDVIYTEYPGMPHNVWDKAYSTPELIDWMFSHVNDSETNVALGANATASHVYSEKESAANAVDGSLSSSHHDNSKWCGNSGANPDWLMLDLGQEHTITRWQVYLAGSGGEADAANCRNFKLQASQDGQSWVDVDTVADNIFGRTNRYIRNTSARYWRLYITTKENGTGTAARIYELELYEKNSDQPVPESYSVSIDPVIGGTASVTADKSSAQAGETVTITVSDVQQGMQIKAVAASYGDGQQASVTAIGDNQFTFVMPESDVTVSVELKQIQVQDAQLVSIGNIEDVTASNNAAKTAQGLGLPSTVAITTTAGDVDAEIIWDVESCEYTPATLGEQQFTVSGQVILPQGVINPDEISTAVDVNVTVSAAELRLDADKEYCTPGSNVVFTTELPDYITKVGITNENNKYLGYVSRTCEPSEKAGYNVWTIVIAPTTTGVRRFGLSVSVLDGDLMAADAVCDVVISKILPKDDSALEIKSVSAPKAAIVNDAFTVTVRTSRSAANIGIFNADTGAALGKIGQSYTDKDGVRIWTVTLKVGTKGRRSFNVKACDISGNWTDNAKSFDIDVYKL